MNLLKILLLLIILTYSEATFSQSDKRLRLTEEQAKSILTTSLSDSTSHNVIGKTPILNEEKEAIEFAEEVLFKVYGRTNIIGQKPYDVFYMEDYWIISGTLPEDMKGGTFLIIIDSRDYRVIRITHGK